MPGGNAMPHGSCDQCLHFRPKRRLEQILKIPTNHPSEALDDIRTREAQWESEESECLIDLLDASVNRWPGRPHVLAYCGLQEEADIFLVYESKNINNESKHADHRCADFTPVSSAPLGFCSTCVHRVQAPGPVQDRKDDEAFVRKSSGMATYDPANHHFDSGWGRVRSTMDAISKRRDADKTADMQGALDSGGITPTPPRYFDYCAKYSGANGYVLCPVRNYHARCPGHFTASTRVAATEASRARGWDDGGTF
jgi:hypothetical protein